MLLIGQVRYDLAVPRPDLCGTTGFGGDTNADVQESVAEARSSKRELVHESDARSP